MADKAAVYVILFVFSGLAGFSTFQVHSMIDLYTEIVQEIGDSLSERDSRIYEITSRLHALEEQRDVERRITSLEKSARVFCLDGKTEMCATLTPTGK